MSSVCFCLDSKSKFGIIWIILESSSCSPFCLHATDLPLGQSGSLHKVRQHSQHDAFWRLQMHPRPSKTSPVSSRRTLLVLFYTWELQKSSPCSPDGSLLALASLYLVPVSTIVPTQLPQWHHSLGGRRRLWWWRGAGGRFWQAESQTQTDLIWERQKHVARCDKGRLCADTSLIKETLCDQAESRVHRISVT